MAASDQQVSYSVKELLAIQTKTLDRIEQKVDDSTHRQAETNAKFDLRLTLLEKKPDLEPRLRVVEDAKTEQAGENKHDKKFWASVIGLVSSSWWLPLLFHYLHGGH
ncbi:MAG: hypothetical protein KGL39_15080 [Patescibacteria group bacterium]|nr:hypothetical protein [Patescibacteria group bacterium]